MSTDDALKTAIQQVAQAKVAEAMGTDIIAKMVQAIMDHKAASSAYGSKRDDRTFIERTVEDHLTDVIRQAVRDNLQAQSEQIRAAVAAAMTDKATTFADTILNAFIGEDWRASLKININREDD